MAARLAALVPEPVAGYGTLDAGQRGLSIDDGFERAETLSPWRILREIESSWGGIGDWRRRDGSSRVGW